MYAMVVVDDEEYILQQLCEAFDWNAMGFSVAGRFGDPEQALAYIRANPTDVLLTDIRLGNGSGLQLAAAAREVRPAIELVLLSAYRDFEYARTAISINVHEYLLKPVTYASVTGCFDGLKKKMDTRSGTATAQETEERNYQIALVKRYLEKHISENVTLESVAEHVSMNPTYFSRFFKRHTGKQFVAYLSELRIEKAVELPENSVISTLPSSGGEYVLIYETDGSHITDFGHAFNRIALLGGALGLFAAFIIAGFIALRLYHNTIRLISLAGIPYGPVIENSRDELDYITESMTRIIDKDKHIERELAYLLTELRKTLAIALQSTPNGSTRDRAFSANSAPAR